VLDFQAVFSPAKCLIFKGFFYYFMLNSVGVAQIQHKKVKKTSKKWQKRLTASLL
jgi:hypothetical protein